jgi:hypothetical protein
MDETTAVEMTLEVGSSEATEEELDELTRQLLQELKQTDVESAGRIKGGSVPIGAKGDPITVASIAITVLPIVLPKIVEAVQAWIMRGSNRTVKFKGKVNGQAVDFEGSSDDLQKLFAALAIGKGKK